MKVKSKRYSFPVKIHIACVITWLIAVLSAYPIVRWQNKTETNGFNSSIQLPSTMNNCDRLNEWEIPDINTLTDVEKVLNPGTD